MFDPVARSRRMVRQATVWQLGIVVLAALCTAAVAPSGARLGFGVMAGGLGVIVSGFLAARITLAAGVVPADAALLRWFSGVLVRWVTFTCVLILAVWRLRLSPLAVLAGVVVALVAFAVLMLFQTSKVSK